MLEFGNENMKKEVLVLDVGRIFIPMKATVLDGDLIRAIQYKNNFHRMLEAGIKLNGYEVYSANEIFSTSWARNERQYKMGLVINWILSVVYVKAKLKRHEGGSMTKKQSRVKRWVLKRIADDDMIMFEHWSSASNWRDMKVDNDALVYGQCNSTSYRRNMKVKRKDETMEYSYYEGWNTQDC